MLMLSRNLLEFHVAEFLFDLDFGIIFNCLIC